ELTVPAVSASADASLRQVVRARQQRKRAGIDDRSHAAARGELVEMTEETESGDVRYRVRLERSEQIRCVAVELGHRLDGCLEGTGRSYRIPLRLQDDPGAERLGQEERVTGT